MLSKEEIKKDIKKLRNISECFTYFMWSENTEALRRILDYIDQLESDKQKLIEKLEKEKFTIESTYSQINGNYFMAQDRLDLIQEILSILK